MKYGTLLAVEMGCWCTVQGCSGPEAPDNSGGESLVPCTIAWKVGACHTGAVVGSRQRNLGRTLVAPRRNSGFSMSDIAQKLHCGEKDLEFVEC